MTDLHTIRSGAMDLEGLQRTLRDTVRGEVRFDKGSRSAYSTDSSNYRQTPIGVVVPRSVDDVVATVAACREHGAPVLSRGGGTSLAGQGTNVAVVIDWSKYLRGIVELDPDRRQARVQPGIVLDELRDAAGEHGLTFGPDPSTHNRNSLGGMIGNNSCGVHSVMAGRTSDNIDELEVLTYDGLRMRVGPTSDEELARIIAEGGRRGEIYAGMKQIVNRHADLIRARFPRIPRRVSGFNLDELLPENGFHVARALVGTEGTCATVLEATCKLVEHPPASTLLVLGYPSVYEAADHVPEILEFGPVGLEGIDQMLIEYMQTKHMHADDRALLPDGEGWLLVEFGGEDNDEAARRARDCMEALRGNGSAPTMKLFEDPEEEEHIWEIRESGLGATARVPGQPDTWPGWEDSAVPPEKVGAYLRELRGLFDEYDYKVSVYGHFGDGCIHCRIPFELNTAQGLRKYESFVEEAADLVLSYGGSVSGEHGDGQARGFLLEKMFGRELVDDMGTFMRLWDPENKMNPGKAIDPDPLLANLRFGTDYHPLPLQSGNQTHFQYPDDDGDFARATTRCVGVGKCRRTEGGTMCPSYMVTLEEEHSTRGRARLLFEMLQGDSAVAEDGWRSDDIHDALDLCLACKGCKGDCPVNVDMATYKAEFLAHYYQGRVRPREAYALGLIYWAARLAARMPDVANAVLSAPVLGDVVKRLGGVSTERSAPQFARETFTTWFQRRGGSHVSGGETVLLWPDTFNNHWHPAVGKATVELLEALGYTVTLPPRILCCGRPLYDYGMLDLAKRQLRQILDALRPQIRAGVTLIGMEPSCLVVFRDELVNLCPNDEDAQRLHDNAVMLTEFLAARADELEWPQSLAGRKAVVHGHCHQKSTLGMDADLDVLGRLGLDVEYLKDAGCCGLAGSFGFEASKYEVSKAVGEHALLPSVRQAGDDDLLITSGYSCREQVEQLGGIRMLHTAEVLRAAFTGGSLEQPLEDSQGPAAVLRANWGVVALTGAVAFTGGALARAVRRR